MPNSSGEFEIRPTSLDYRPRMEDSVGEFKINSTTPPNRPGMEFRATGKSPSDWEFSPFGTSAISPEFHSRAGERRSPSIRQQNHGIRGYRRKSSWTRDSVPLGLALLAPNSIRGAVSPAVQQFAPQHLQTQGVSNRCAPNPTHLGFAPKPLPKPPPTYFHPGHPPEQNWADHRRRHRRSSPRPPRLSPLAIPASPPPD
jgi:hypothetical protein